MSSKFNTPKVIHVEIKASHDSDGSSMFACSRDEASINVGDWSEERLQALLAETNEKIKDMWAYLEKRESRSKESK